MRNAKKRTLAFAYNLMWERYMEIYRARKMQSKELSLIILEAHLKTMQKIMIDSYEMEVTFKKFPKWRKS